MVALWLLAGCTTPPGGIFMGEIPTTIGVRVALAANETKVGLYVAGDADTLLWSRYYEGNRKEDGSFEATADGWTASGGDVAGGGFEVLLTDPDGLEEPAFTLQPPVDPGSPDGPYTGTGAACTAGGVVFNSGGQILGATCMGDGTPVLIEVAGLTFLQEDLQLEVDVGNGPEELVLSPALPK